MHARKKKNFFPRSSLGLSRCPKAQSSMWTGVGIGKWKGVLGIGLTFIGRLVYRGAPLPPAVVKLDLPQHLPGGE